MLRQTSSSIKADPRPCQVQNVCRLGRVPVLAGILWVVGISLGFNGNGLIVRSAFSNMPGWNALPPVEATTNSEEAAAVPRDGFLPFRTIRQLCQRLLKLNHIWETGPPSFVCWVDMWVITAMRLLVPQLALLTCGPGSVPVGYRFDQSGKMKILCLDFGEIG